jgi:hypothetical protein
MIPYGGSENPCAEAISGGGGNRTRATFPRRCPQLNAITNAAWTSKRRFGLAFEWTLYHSREAMLGGPVSKIYCIAEEGGRAWKIGLARSPVERLATLQIGNPRPLVLFAWAPAPTRLEGFVHRVLRRERIHGEWFYGPRTLAVASMIASAQEIGSEVARWNGSCDATDTMYALTSIIDDLLLEARRAA